MEYWAFTLFSAVVSIALFGPLFFEFFWLDAQYSYLEGPLETGDQEGEISVFSLGAAVVGGLFMLFCFIPGLAVSVRRFHDVGMSGWIYVALYVGGVIFGIVGLGIFVISLLPSKVGVNKWGNNPKDPYGADVFA